MKRLKRLQRFFVSRFQPAPTPNLNNFLHEVSGVVHVGASRGQERTLYQQYGLRVLWIEPIQEVFEDLQANLKKFPL